MKLKNSFFLVLILISSFVYSQTDSKDSIYYQGLIQFTGVVVSNDSVNPVPFAHIIDLSRHSGTTSDYFGYFSFVAHKGDTIRFTSVGYKASYFYIPDTLTANKYSLIHVMHADTILLDEANIYPWPSKEQFADAFVNTKIPNDDYKRAEANLNDEAMAAYAEQIPMNGQMNFNWQMQQVQNKLYYSGQYPPNNLLNPIAWAKFIKAWKNGDFKKKEND
ncbi:MAG: carboxypeptidase-like regulatory domain-containing protein [Flavobacteriales bacterium]|nr:carboxypeptidase-like regulatory domain-containing protein [Flavobacteriales bacterium]MCB9197790.1 carboxypeptidase-like regulatory domain-containing protein [Flavobacteriales bacterium]